jgi:hypothetical protein
MADEAITRRKFVGNAAPVGLGVLAHPTFSAKVFGANDRLVMGIIGAGGMGRGHMENFKNQSVGWGVVCDVYGVNLDTGLEIAGLQATGYTDHRKLLERKDIDAVLIATPEHWHHDHLVDTLRAGKDGYCEKPMPWSIWQGVSMVAEVRKTDRIVQVGIQNRVSGVGFRMPGRRTAPGGRAGVTGRSDALKGEQRGKEERVRGYNPSVTRCACIVKATMHTRGEISGVKETVKG